MAYVLRVEPAVREKTCCACHGDILKGDIHLGTWAGTKSKNSKGSICRKCIIKFFLKVMYNSGSDGSNIYVKGRKIATVLERASGKRECKKCGKQIVKDDLCLKIDNGNYGTACGSICVTCISKIGEELYDHNMVEEIFKESL